MKLMWTIFPSQVELDISSKHWNEKVLEPDCLSFTLEWLEPDSIVYLAILQLLGKLTNFCHVSFETILKYVVKVSHLGYHLPKNLMNPVSLYSLWVQYF